MLTAVLGDAATSEIDAPAQSLGAAVPICSRKLVAADGGDF